MIFIFLFFVFDSEVTDANVTLFYKRLISATTNLQTFEIISKLLKKQQKTYVKITTKSVKFVKITPK